MVLHLFEFMDLPWLPTSLRSTLRESLDCALSAPFRSYYDWVVDEIVQQVRTSQIKCVVEVGAGTAPISRRLAEVLGERGPKLVPCDLHPDILAFEQLEQEFPGIVAPIYEPVDMTQTHDWGEDVLIVLSASFHHVTPLERKKLVKSLTNSSFQVSVFEPLRRHLVCQLFAWMSLIPALATPIRRLGDEGTWRRVVWCWLLPIAPIMLAWDGWVSCLRMWSENQWREATGHCGIGKIRITKTPLSLSVSWRRQK